MIMIRGGRPQLHLGIRFSASNEFAARDTLASTFMINPRQASRP
jgi:hypothetical protein